jgi:hypothetical protein
MLRVPVLVELFTSEGCSSCPPADAALAKFASDQTVPGVEIVALEEHVDYWNHLGWADPFSARAFSLRQATYGEALGSGIYTPQMVIDGQTELVGSNRPKVVDEIMRAATHRKSRLAISARNSDSERDVARVRVNVEDPRDGDLGADLWLAITEDGLSTNVASGENGGRTLVHGSVVRYLQRVGAVDGRMALDADVRVAADWKRERLRIVAFAQEARSHRIIGVATTSIPPKPPQ